MLRRPGRWQTAVGFELEDQAIGVSFSDAEFPHAALAAAAGSPVAISHVANDPRMTIAVVRRLRLSSLLVAPLFARDVVAGVLALNWHRAEVPLNEAARRFAGNVAALLGLAIEAGRTVADE